MSKTETLQELPKLTPQERDEVVTIVAVIHAARRNRRWQERL